MDFAMLGPWLALSFGLIPVVTAVVALAALRGTKPKERAEILLALAALVAALVFRFRAGQEHSARDRKVRVHRTTSDLRNLEGQHEVKQEAGTAK